MKYKLRETDQSQVLQEPISQTTHPEPTYEILNVSGDFHMHEAISDKLRHFSMNSRKLSVFRASDITEAILIIGEHPQIDLIVIDSTVQVNGSYKEMLRYLKEDVKNNKCYIVFRDEVPLPVSMSDSETISNKGFAENDTEAGRDRLIDIIRMIMLTCDMEWKLNSQIPVKEISDKNLSEVPNGLTRENLYTILASDMKEPVGNMKVMLDFLTNEPDLLDPETSRDLLLNVRESIHNIHELLENFLFWTRLHKHDIDFKPIRIDLAHIIRVNMMMMKTIASNKEIVIKQEVVENIRVQADEIMLTTVLRNLIYNAIKSTRKKGIIELSVNVYPEYAEVKVKDDGIGLSEKVIEKIFSVDPYNPLRGKATESGTGLGLILCKDFIEKNGGRLRIESIINEGSTFSFTIPLWKTPCNN